jgi:urease accessory protein
MRRLFAAVPLALLPSAALAHTGQGATHDLLHGLVHPLTGIDHVLAMIGVGLLAAQLGGRALWLVPGAFVAVMAAAGVAGMASLHVPFVESGIALSVIVIGAAIALQVSMPLTLAMTLVGFFAIFHGYAHGAEMPADLSLRRRCCTPSGLRLASSSRDPPPSAASQSASPVGLRRAPVSHC